MAVAKPVSHARLPSGAFLQISSPNGVDYYIQVRGRVAESDLEAITRHTRNYIIETKKGELVVLHFSKTPSWLISSVVCALKLSIPAIALYYEPENKSIVVCSNSSAYPLGTVSGGEKQ